MYNAPRVIEEVANEYFELSGRKYEHFEAYRMDDAEAVVITLGSSAGTTKDVVDSLRDRGVKAGMIKIRVFRPFPHQLLKEALSNVKSIAVFDRSISFGAQGGPVHSEVRSSMYGADIPIYNYIYGLGGRDLTPDMVESAYNDLIEGKDDPEMRYLGLRE
jgi:pyruvate ferredoxin oxidoreductase alpha subunit